MTIAAKLLLLASSKDAIRSAIQDQGVAVSTTTPFSDYARLVSLIGTAAPVFTTAPTLSGPAVVGRTITVSVGVASGIPAPVMTVQILRDGSPISGATGTSYVITDTDKDKRLSARVTAKNKAGQVSFTTAEIGPVIVVVDPTWSQERAVTIANGSNAATTGYQSLVLLNESNFDFTNALANGADLRFTDTDKTTQLPFWVESFDKTAKKAVVWVRADLPAGASKTIYLYSANDQAVTKSNGDMVFPMFDDFTGMPGWNVYSVTNPVISTASGESIVGDPMVLPPDAITNEWGAFYFISASGGFGHVGYFTISGDGSTFTRFGKVLDSSTTAYKRVIKPNVIYWPADNCYYMVATCENDSASAVLGLFKSTSRTSGWTFVKVLMTADPSLYFMDNGVSTQLENTFIDCGCFLLDGNQLRLYYSANTIGNKEPKYFCLANFEAGPTSTLTRYAGNPIAKPNPATSFANTGLGGMSVRKITEGDMAGKYEFSYNAFIGGEVSHSFIGYSNDAFSITIRDEDRAIPLGGPSSWNRVRNYRICGYNFAKPKEAATQAVLNALGDTEMIGYIKKGQKLDLSKWVPRLQGQPRINFENGLMRMGETRTTNLSYYFLLENAYVPGDDVIIETRARLDTSFASGTSVFAPILLASSERPAPDAVANLHAVFVMDRYKQVRHQNKSGGSWGSEDTITTSYPPTNAFWTYRMIKKAASMDYEVVADDGTMIGKITGNTDAPQGASLPFTMGGQGAEMSFDYVRARKYLANVPAVTVGAVTAVSKTGL